MAAVLALRGGDGSAGGAVLSHRSAAALWGMLPPVDGPVDVSLPSRSGRRKRRGIHVHRPRSLEPGETTSQHGIPVTSPARTLADLASVVPGRVLRRATRQAEFLELPIGPAVAADGIRSELERRFLWLCARHHLPRPAVNMPIGEMTVDFCWAERRLIVETDGYGPHRGRAAFEGDRARDLRLRTLGYDVLRFSHRQVFDEPDRLIGLLAKRLTPPPGAR
jgi:very-short-patch-repair endonuclease